MEPIEFTKAYYLKLGAGGKYEKASIGHNKARIGWNGLSVEEINGRKWEILKEKLRAQGWYKTKSAATNDINALRVFVESTPSNIWITFHASRLWWGRLRDSIVYEDEISRYRFLVDDWCDHDINGHCLLVNQIPGSISKVQRFQGTICEVKAIDDLRRLLNDQPSQTFQAVSEARDNLAREVQEGIRKLHWKDFETLVDLIFRNAGWNRTSVVGETMKYSDLELEERITGERYQVQVKSQATIGDFEEYAKNFAHGNFRKLYFVVHSPDEKLATYHSDLYPDVELILPEKLAQMLVDHGLMGWLLKKIK